jgi:hypothetical protein
VDLTRSKTELVLENALLRQQLIVLKRQAQRPALSWRDRAPFVLLASKLHTWKQALLIVKPDTLLHWHRELFRRIWRRKSTSKKKPGRPPLAGAIVALIQLCWPRMIIRPKTRRSGGVIRLGYRA